MPSFNDNFFRYLPISERNIRWDLYVTGAGLAGIPAGGKYPPLGHPNLYDFNWEAGRVLPEYQILYLSQGEGIFESASTGEVRVKKGNIIILFPGVWHRYCPSAKTGWREHWIGINGEYLYRLHTRNLISPDRAVLHIDHPELLLDTYYRIYDTIEKHPSSNSYILAAYGMEILATAVEAATPDGLPGLHPSDLPPHSVEDKIVAMAIELIWNHSHRPIGVADVADALPVTRRTLERRFRKNLGHTIAEEITLSRIARAKHLLAETKLPIEHVALAVGFSGADRLGKVFRHWEEITPGMYRKQFSKG